MTLVVSRSLRILTGGVAVAMLASSVGCVVRPQTPRLRLHLGGSASAPAPAPAYASSAPPAYASSADAPEAAAPACGQELGRDASDEPPGATPVEPGSYAACLGIGDPRDHFLVTAPTDAPSTLFVIRVTDPHGFDPCIGVKDEDRRDTFFRGCAGTRGADQAVWSHVAAGTSATIVISSSLNQERTENPYRLTIEAIPVYEPEPNDAFTQAVPVRPGESAKALAVGAVNRDKARFDVFVVDVPRAGTLQLAIVDPAPETGMVLELYDADRRQLASRHPRNDGANVRLEHELTEGGRYYVRVYDRSNFYGAYPLGDGGEGEPPPRATHPYTLTTALR